MTPDSAAEAAACRRLWQEVLLAVMSDYWKACQEPKADLSVIRADALRYFRSRDGKTVVSLSGVTESPDRLADVAVDPTAQLRTKLQTDGGSRPAKRGAKE